MTLLLVLLAVWAVAATLVVVLICSQGRQRDRVNWRAEGANIVLEPHVGPDPADPIKKSGAP